METEILLPFWPTCFHALQWSPDNMIAVAGGGMVGILIPRLDVPFMKPLKWDTVILKVDGFTQAEIPLTMPLNRKDWSVGEELAMRNVSALRWSPQGLGMFSSSVLAILYSDHSLVLWECIGRPEVNDNWKKALVINHAVQQFYARSAEQPRTNLTSADQVQISQRIRAFAWRPDTCVNGQGSSTSQLLAVSTDAGEILIINVQSPYDTLSASGSSWRADVAYRISCSGLLIPTATASPFQQIARDMVTDVSWLRVASHGASVVAFIVNGHLYHIKVFVDDNPADPTISTAGVESLPANFSEFRGIMHDSRSPGTIVGFSSNELRVLHLGEGDHNHNKAVQHQRIDTHWSEISGIAQSYDAKGKTSIQLSTHRSCHLSKDAQLSLSSNGFSQAPAPPWHRMLCKTVESFNTLHRLQGNVQIRTHGLAVMPEGSLAVTCVSMLPGDSIAHIINSDQTSSVLVCDNRERSYQHSAETNKVSNPATSSILLNVRCDLHVENLDINHMNEAQLASRLRAMTVPDDSPSPKQGPVDSHTPSIEYIRHSLYHSMNMIDARSKLLARRICNDSIKAQVSTDAYKELNLAIYQISQVETGGGILSQGLRTCHRRFKQAIDSTAGDFGARQDEWQESCGICHQRMHFEAVKWARCESGHRFVRCALTLVAILQPGISKSCMICGIQYLNELKMDEICSLLAQDSTKSLQ